MLGRFLDSISTGNDALADQIALNLAALSIAEREEAIQELGALLENPDEDIRWWTVRALSEIPDSRTPLLLTKLLADPNPAIRQCAALGIRLQPDPLAVPDLIHALDDPDPLAARLAADALTAIGVPAVSALQEAVKNGTHTVRLLAVRTLACIQDPGAIPALFSALDDSSMLVEYWANEGLERMGVGMVFFKP